MCYCLSVFLVAHDIQACISNGFKRKSKFDLQAKEDLLNGPLVNAFATFETACPNAAAYSGGSSESLEQCTFGITRVCPLLRGIIS
jgi:hypothetical protein